MIKVEHGGNGVDPQTVDMIRVEPEVRVREQEREHFAPSIVKDKCAPLIVLALPRVGVLVNVGAIKEAQAMPFLREVGRHPVEEYADTMLMTVIDKVHEIV